MAMYAIGDVQGCFTALQQLLLHIAFKPAHDRLWFVGDLVNRGPDSLRVLRYVKELGSAAVIVLGNHDLFLMAADAGLTTLRPTDTLQPILLAPDREELLAWLLRQPILYRHDPFVMVHAGLLPQWTVEEAEDFARDIETALRGPDSRTLLRAYLHAHTVQWSDTLTGTDRLVALLTVFTRLRTCTSEGQMDIAYTGPPTQAPPGFAPWFQLPTRRRPDTTIICGHWAALGLHIQPTVLALDSGCVWGKQLSALRLEDRHVFQVCCTPNERASD